MPKLLQNRISENRVTLPFIAAYSLALWLICGLIANNWWLQFVCFTLSTYLMIELNNRNALIRIYSKMVSCCFLVLSTAACFMFSELRESLASTLMIASCILLFRTYQNQDSTGAAYYTFLCISMASLAYVQTLLYVPFYWLMMIFFIQSIGMRMFVASLLGVITPYWFATAYFIYIADFSVFFEHFDNLIAFSDVFSLSILTLEQSIILIFTVILFTIGCVHFLNTSYNDKIRTRMMYYCFILMGGVSVILVLLLPQHYGLLMRMIIISTCPLIAHFIALTKTRITNITFCIMVVTALAITGYNVWTTL